VNNHFAIAKRKRDNSMSFFDTADDAVEQQKAADDEASNANKYEPSAGQTVQAVLLKADLFTGGQYEPAITITFRNVGDKKVGGIEAGESGRMFLQTVLKRKMMEAAPAIGSPFILRYEGKVTPASGGNPYNDWTVVTPWTQEGDEAARDRVLWDGINPDGVVPMPTKAKAQGVDESSWKF
jgi:hypothetical protein